MAKKKSRPDILVTLGQKIARLREKKKMSYLMVQRASGEIVSDSSMMGYEEGGEMGITKFLALCLAMDIAPADLLPAAVSRILQPGRLTDQEKVAAITALRKSTHEADP